MNCLQWNARRFFRPKIFFIQWTHLSSTYNCSGWGRKSLFSVLSPYKKNSSSIKSSEKYILLASILSWFGFKKEEEDTLISVIKLGVLSDQREEYDKAENIFHLALKLAQERRDMQAQTYIFDLLANTAFKKGDFRKAEKLFIQVTKELIASGTPLDDNAIVEISLKLASIYSQINEHQKAETGFKFCIDTQQKKINEIDMSDADSLSDYQKDTLLLWAMSIHWYGRYLSAQGLHKDAKENFEKALEVSEKVNGKTHPQTLVVLNDIGTVHSLLEEYGAAIDVFKKAIVLSHGTDSLDVPAFYCNLGSTYLNSGNTLEGEKACRTALNLAKKINNFEAEKDAIECLAEISGLKS